VGVKGTGVIVHETGERLGTDGRETQCRRARDGQETGKRRARDGQEMGERRARDGRETGERQVSHPLGLPIHEAHTHTASVPVLLGHFHLMVLVFFCHARGTADERQRARGVRQQARGMAGERVRGMVAERVRGTAGERVRG